MAGNKRQIQEINAGSMADIAFLLLIFFLVATTMNVDTGLARMLPPMPPEDVKLEDIKVKDRNVLLVFVSPGGNIMVGDEEMQIQGVKDKTKEFILNPMEAENLPEKKETELELPDGSKWVYPVSEGVVSLQTTRDTNYDVYIMVQNELTPRLQRSARRGCHVEVRRQILGTSRGAAQCNNQSGTVEGFGGGAA